MKKYTKLLLGTLLASYATVGAAGALEKFYKVDTQLSYQSNPGFSDIDKRSVWALRVKPSAQLQYADELNQYNLDIGFNIYQNSNEDVLLNYVAPELRADWSRELEFGRVGLEAKYDQFAARAESLLLNGVNLDVENVRKTANIKGIFDIDFNATYSLNNSAEYRDITYSEDTANLNDYDLMSASSQLIRKSSDRFSAYATVNYSDLNPKGAGSIDSDVYGLVVGGIYTPSDEIRVNLAVGGYDASGRFDDSGVKIDSDGYYVYNRTRLSYRAYRKMNAGGNGIYQLNELVNVNAKYQLTELSNMGVSVTRVWSTPDSSVSNNDVVFDTVRLSYQRIYEDWKAKAFVSFVGLEISGDQRRQNVVGILLSYDPFDFNESRRNPLNF